MQQGRVARRVYVHWVDRFLASGSQTTPAYLDSLASHYDPTRAESATEALRLWSFSQWTQPDADAQDQAMGGAAGWHIRTRPAIPKP